MESLFILILGFFAGTASGFLGVGGGVLVVPVLTAMGYKPLHAIGTSALMIVMTSFAGSWKSLWDKQVSFKEALPLALPSLLFAQLGVLIVNHLQPSWILASFSVFVFLTFYLMRLRRRLQEPDKSTIEESGHSLTQYIWIGSVGGFSSGLFGVGGGLIFVPLLVMMAHLSIKKAVRLSLLVVFFTALSSSLGHLKNGNVLYGDSVMLGATGIFGSQMGLFLLKRLDEKTVRVSFEVFLLGIGCFMAYRAWL